MDETLPGSADVPARTVDPGRGLAWWTEAWALFMRSAVLWVALGLILIVVFAVISMVPLLGAVATALLTPVFFGSWMQAAHKVDAGGVLEVADLFSAFKGAQLTPLIVLGALFAAATVVIFLVAGVLGAGAVFGMFHGGMHQSGTGLLAGLGVGLMAMLFFLAFGLLATAAIWFAPALVVFRNITPVDALKASFAAVFRNWLPFLVYGVIEIVLAIVASIPFALGWLVLMPVLMLTAYVSYRDVFGTAAAPTAA
jgi:uncharacterized membrane protein